MGLFLRSNDSTRFSYFTEVNIRLDQLANAAVFYDHTLAKEAKAGIGLLQKNFNKLNVDVSYRDFRLLDSAVNNLKPEQTLLSRIEYDYGFFKRFVTANTYVQLGSGNELRRDFQYVEVAPGLGVYVWKDFNEYGFPRFPSGAVTVSFLAREEAEKAMAFRVLVNELGLSSTLESVRLVNLPEARLTPPRSVPFF
jgi:hypothetical protein